MEFQALFESVYEIDRDIKDLNNKKTPVASGQKPITTEAQWSFGINMIISKINVGSTKIGVKLPKIILNKFSGNRMETVPGNVWSNYREQQAASSNRDIFLFTWLFRRYRIPGDWRIPSYFRKL